jgi:chemotaxis signal transduction protein
MQQKSHILICGLCDFFIGFDITEVDQIVQKKQVEIHAEQHIVDFRGYTVPFFDLHMLFHCGAHENNFLLLLNSPSGRFCVSVKEVRAIVPVEHEGGMRIAKSMKHLVAYDYANRIILWESLPIPVIATERISAIKERGACG